MGQLHLVAQHRRELRLGRDLVQRREQITSIQLDAAAARRQAGVKQQDGLQKRRSGT
jgi:hypothetical protein